MKKINKLITLILVLGLFSPITTLALTKKETIYNTIDYTGKVEKTIINNHLFEPNKGKVEDETELKKILNINGDETFKLEGNKLIWNSNGKDIFYRGEINKELPLSIKTTYYLDGKEVNPKKIVGKKGNIEIRLQFTNNSYSKEDNMYLPLVVTVGTMFKNKDNYNIEISNGKAVDTGTKSIALGLSSPGLYENTGISQFSNFDEATIKYDTNNFRLSNIYIIATPKVLESSDFNVFSKIDSLYSAVDKLNTNMDKIDSGAKELNSGLKQVVNKLEIATSSMNNNESMNQLYTLKQGNNTAIEKISNANLLISNNFTAQGLNIELTEEELKAMLIAAGMDEATITNLISYKKTYDGNKELIYLLNQNNNAIDGTLQSSNNTISLITQLKDALIKLENGSSTLSNGISQFNTEGIKKIVGYSNKFKVYTEKAKRVLNKSKEYKGFGSNNVTRTTFVFKMKSIK